MIHSERKMWKNLLNWGKPQCAAFLFSLATKTHRYQRHSTKWCSGLIFERKMSFPFRHNNSSFWDWKWVKIHTNTHHGKILKFEPLSELLFLSIVFAVKISLFKNRWTAFLPSASVVFFRFEMADYAIINDPVVFQTNALRAFSVFPIILAASRHFSCVRFIDSLQVVVAMNLSIR